MTVTGRPVTLLALGNPLCGDDGIGLAALEQLQTGFQLPEQVHALDGGTLGLALLSHLQDVERLIILDAICAAGPPGSLVRIAGDDVEAALVERLSVHQVGVADLFQALRLLDGYPAEALLLGLVPESLDAGLGLSAAAESGLPALVDAIVRELERLGCAPLPRKARAARAGSRRWRPASRPPSHDGR